MEKISAVYKIVNTVTGDFYIGSSKNVKMRWAQHKCPSVWKEHPDSPLYLDMQKYGLDRFRFQILAPVIPEYLKDVEQELIEMLHPTYNDRRANGLDVERQKESRKNAVEKYQQSEKGKEWRRSEKGRKVIRKSLKKYANKLCFYNGETLKLITLAMRFQRAGISHATLEAKKYLIKS